MKSVVSMYEQQLLPYLMDLVCGLAPITRMRKQVVPKASGRVLEIGTGTGRNLPFYDPGRVTALLGIDRSNRMHEFARRRSNGLTIPIQLLEQSAEHLTLDSHSFDCVVCTYTLCSLRDPAAALHEMRRVLVPGGRLLLVEHGLAPDSSVARLQHRLEPYWSKIAGGCHLTRNVPKLLRDAGFRDALESGYISSPKFLSYHFWGEATAHSG